MGRIASRSTKFGVAAGAGMFAFYVVVVRLCLRVERAPA